MDLKRFKIFVASLIFLSTTDLLPTKIFSNYNRINNNCQGKKQFDRHPSVSGDFGDLGGMLEKLYSATSPLYLPRRNNSNQAEQGSPDDDPFLLDVHLIKF